VPPTPAPRPSAALAALTSARAPRPQVLLVQIEGERKRWQAERAEMLEEMAEEVRVRRLPAFPHGFWIMV
jgi:hypothetical protein